MITMKRSIISILIVGLFAGTAFAVSAADEVKTEAQPAENTQSRSADPDQKDENSAKNKSMHDKGDAAFKKADKDNDGTLDKKEAKAMPRVAKHFKAIDTDKDGTVSLEEVHTYMEAHPRTASNK
jgi:Ca2+-binding EF-hand superfamily protein